MIKTTVETPLIQSPACTGYENLAVNNEQGWVLKVCFDQQPECRYNFLKSETSFSAYNINNADEYNWFELLCKQGKIQPPSRKYPGYGWSRAYLYKKKSAQRVGF